MAAKHAIVTLNSTSWTEITDSGGTTGDCSVELLDDMAIELEVNSSGTVPDDGDVGTFTLEGRASGWNGVTLEEMFPGVSGAIHLYGKSLTPGGAQPRVSISHPA